jgi:FAD:protein FMN transferase
MLRRRLESIIITISTMTTIPQRTAQRHRAIRRLAAFSSSHKEVIHLARPAQTNQSLAPTPHSDLFLPAGMQRQEFHAMGTTVELLLPQEQVEQGSEAVRQLFSHWEQTLSRFQADSELSRLNRTAGKPMRVSRLLLDVLQKALTAAQATGGMFDPTLLNQLVRIGYDRSFDILPLRLPDTVSSAIPGGSWRAIKIQHDDEQAHVTLPEGAALDFGGIAKGMAVDASLNRLKQLGMRTALVNAGGDLALLGLPAHMEHWSVGIQGKGVTWNIPLRSGALATSGTGRRRWQQGTQHRHHLIDPRTGESAPSALWSVTVVAERCEQAEVAAKVAFLLGPEGGKTFLQQHGLAGLLLFENGEWTTAGPWPVDRMQTIEEN